ncbi:hypothetical protein A7985_07450 [Pseudoalteromonas luteoviolacea]|uniref:Uncharacterized protein n=1 Tax=Pseudoalteromonas luteoviolacea TaxID=43657 RepID=A0A1C0TWR2_9GAMM|nr:hypothetical protein [Pseudoalteromonas luteoviolacea]MBQ4810288.1 hypothetical protein [Pseudoalteromonas luteoviolacea]OCQ23766.1 hypothetical protein A7985_07450 [Pseudoalteromonas luteoviolacea]
MKIHRLIIFSLLIYTSYSHSTELKILEFKRYGATPSLELALVKSEGYQAKDIFKVLEFTRQEFSLRLIGQSSEKTNNELLEFYKLNYSSELVAAKKSSGNLHNPAFHPLMRAYERALKSTTLFQDINIELSKRGYVVSEIDFEKFSINNGVISIPDTYISVVSKPNKQLNRD